MTGYVSVEDLVYKFSCPVLRPVSRGWPGAPVSLLFPFSANGNWAVDLDGVPCISLFPISHVASCVAAVDTYIVGIRDVIPSILSRA